MRIATIATDAFHRSRWGLRILSLFTISCLLPAATFLRAQDPAAGPAQNGQASSSQREVSWKKLPGNFLADQKEIWLFPVQLRRGHHWLPALCVLGATTGLLFADAHDAPYFRRTSNFQGFNRGFSGPITASEIALIPASFYLSGLIRKDSYSQRTALLAGEAVADSLALNLVMKVASRRLRPSDIAPTGNFSDTFFRSNASVLNGSFPSAHAMAAFSIATVFARRYRDHRWVPWVAYGMAGVICFSRITLQSHFPSDVFLGAALAYPIARFVVLQGQ
ncbi:MAG: phosphatase PAP2 family protein [Candidatus Acidiferrales bacterium]